MWALTYRCNMSCEYCYLHDKIHNWSELSSKEIISLAHSIAENDQWKPDAIWLTGGEPTIVSCLPQIIQIFNKSNIKSIITTNGYCNSYVLNSILQSVPRGINVSIDSFDSEKNERARAYTQEIIKNVKYIARYKHPNTILGASCVFTPDNIPLLKEFACDLQEAGVEYLSLNPISGKGKIFKKEDFDLLDIATREIKEKIGLQIPSSFFISLVKDYFLANGKIFLKCPAGNSFYFISPWGEWFPCSNEMWQSNAYKVNTPDITSITDGLAGDLDYNVINTYLNEKYRVNDIFTDSMCFSDRCIGCWKLYYDTIFT